ncbi:14 kDa phosphohistidine phosphatase-like [Oopsacas minuta]|uniref:14 kDa phosphohistidine phosphatase-like n=1 Tax=Oopsacas minuta TaxID=111878 RepID=A0AAV7JSF4_9METZ|nr:14 kDa phosphohistidine phosphatase-like [Oopsacas minuta]
MAIPCPPIPTIDIDEEGRFKYILIRLKDKSTKKYRYIVRGYKWASFHAAMIDELEPTLKKTNLVCECVGGGRILHTPDENKLFVYGYSVCYGRADHNITVSLLKKKFPEYTSITFSNEGY